MIKVVSIWALPSGMSESEFEDWYVGRHIADAKKIPGLRRYIQCHLILDFAKHGGMTHDGWSEFWFDDLEAFCDLSERRILAVKRGLI
jgi:uncharacterized protein (TIGR02118 family)